jgi:hypothetical protein
MRDAGVAPDIIGAFLGHRDSRMAERVYARPTRTGLATRIRQQMGAPDCSAFVATPSDEPPSKSSHRQPLDVDTAGPSQ